MNIEAGVEHDPKVPVAPREPQQVREGPGLVVADDLWTAGAIDARHTGEVTAEFVRYLIRHRHRAIASAGPVREYAGRLAFEHAGAKRLIPHTPLEDEIESVAKVNAIRSCEHAAMP